MRAAMAQQMALKQKNRQHGVSTSSRKSFFQRTPAFIYWAAQAALQELQAMPADNSPAYAEDSTQPVPLDPSAASSGQAAAAVRPPGGGFTDVGPHAACKPKATTWPVLQSMIKASTLY
jgi:hypothetical protein